MENIIHPDFPTATPADARSAAADVTPPCVPSSCEDQAQAVSASTTVPAGMTDAPAPNTHGMQAQSVHAPEIRFPQGLLRYLRDSLLSDTREEHFALLLARREQSPAGQTILVVDEAQLPGKGDIESSARFHVRPSRAFIASVLAEVQARPDVDCIVDVHTHPFAARGHFSGVDDEDERTFCRCLTEEVDERIHYASIVLGTTSCSARLWHMTDGAAICTQARVRTQTALETIPCEGFQTSAVPCEMLARAELALGVDTLRRMTADQRIVLAGAGGIGSVLAEMLARSGFTHIGLIDDDLLEVTNLNRFAGGYHEDVGKPKVEVIARHLERIRPGIEVTALQQRVDSPEAESLMAAADWVLLSTDSHSSRHAVQQTCLRYAVPLISAGVNISVEKDDAGRPHITDQSGEVIVIRYGDGFCLTCLGRIAPARVAAESHPDPAVRQGLVERGYVQGMDVKEPAVMPLNAVVAAQTVQALMDQYREGAAHEPITVYESHDGGRMYADWESLADLPRHCFSCGRDLSMEDAGGEEEPSSRQDTEAGGEEAPKTTDNGEHDGIGPTADTCPQKNSREAEKEPSMFADADAEMDEDAPDAVPASGKTASRHHDLSSFLHADDAPAGDLRP